MLWNEATAGIVTTSHQRAIHLSLLKKQTAVMISLVIVENINQIKLHCTRFTFKEVWPPFLACSRACASKVFSLRADCGRVIVYPGLKQWERPRHNIFGVCTRLAGGVCMSTSANSSASKHLTVTKIVWKIVYVTFDYLISHFFKILSLEFMANLFRDFRASVSLKVFHYRLRGKWCQYDLEIN